MSEHGEYRLLLFCEDLGLAPEGGLPEGYSIRWYQPGDQAAWLRIHELADRLTNLAPGFFKKKFGSDEAFLGSRQAYALDHAGSPVGTVTAWSGFINGQRLGRVHWLAVIPAHQGRGLGSALLSVACKRLRQEGFVKAYLLTHPARTEALRLYERAGFHPLSR